MFNGNNKIVLYYVFIVNSEHILHLVLVFLLLEAVVQRCSVKKVFLEMSQNSQENTCARVLQLY